MVLYVSCADDYILNIRQRLILIAPKIVATVVLGGLYIRTIPDFDVFADIDVAILNNFIAFVVFHADTRYGGGGHHSLGVQLYQRYLW